jgi:hypothetical protein
MRVNTLGVGLVSTLFLGSLPGTQALPKWLQLNRGDDSRLAPRQYSVYETPPVTYGGYSWYGYGPLPTLTSKTPSGTLTQSNSGEETSASSVSYTGE